MKLKRKLRRYAISLIIGAIVFYGIVFYLESQKMRVVVICDEDTISLSIEDYLIYCLSYDMQLCESSEYLKARTVMLRSEIVYKMGSEKSIDSDKLDMPYVSEGMLKRMWGDEYNRKLGIVKKAIKDTKGEIMCSGNKTIMPKYHILSSGYIRGDGQYCKELKAESDCREEDYCNTYLYTYDELNELNLDSDICVVSKKDGYVILVCCGEVLYEGEYFAKMLKLPSQAFDIKRNDDGYEIVTYGIGDGYGMSLRYAAHLANEGLNYMDILKTFYKNVTLRNV